MENYNGAELKRLLIEVTKISASMQNMEKDIAELKRDYITRKEFEPVQRIVYGLVGLVLVAVVTALVALVVSGGGVP